MQGNPDPTANLLADLDAFDVDNLLTFFNQPGYADSMVPGMMNPQMALNRNMAFPDATAAYHPMHLNPAANLFSTIAIPNFIAGTAAVNTSAPAAPTQTAGGSDSADPSAAGDTQDRPKNASVQEKNRRAQKRFRERQKAKMKDMSEHLDDMTSELSKLRMENNALKNRNNVLEKVLTLRDEHIRVMQDEQHVFDLGTPYLQAGNNNPNQKLLLGPAESSAPASSNAIISLDVKTIKAMPADVVINCWKDTVRDLGNILVTLESNPDESSVAYQEAMDSLCRVLDYAGQLCMNTAVLHPTNMQRLIASTLDDGRSGASPEDKQRWLSVATSLQLSESQKGQMVSLRHIFVRRMNRMMDERKLILQRLQQVNVPDRMMALQSVISETLKVNSCTMELKANLQEEHLAGLELIGTVFKTILSPVQKARAIVQSYPFYPDIYQIATALAGDDGRLPSIMLEDTNNTAAAYNDVGHALLTVPTAYKRN